MPGALLRILRATLIAGFVGLLAGPAFTAAQQDYDNCGQTQDINLSIAACTRIADNQNETAEDRISAHIQIGNDYYNLNNAAKALDAYQAAQAIDGSRSSRDALSVQIYASEAIAQWRLYQIGHDPVKWMMAAVAFNMARTMDVVSNGKNFNALVDGNSTLQEIRSSIDAAKKK